MTKGQTTMKNAINWFEIITRDMDKAVRFYEATLAEPIKREVFGGVPHGVFGADTGKGGVHGALVIDPKRAPGAGGTLIYFNCEDGVPAVVERATRAGATVLVPTMSIGEHGWIAVISDLDGNHVGLHAAPTAS
jgi:predicted enzyme related to lactoylglutathione lyase